jgi:mono/diheme cytochrome c family protein
MQIKEISQVLLTTLGLFAVAFGLASALRPEPPGESLAESPAPPTNEAATASNPPTTDQVKQGASLFSRNCAHCHGDDARGDEGPDLHDLTKSDGRITKILKEGIKGEMPKFGSKFSDTDIQALIAFLRTLKN